MPDNRTLGEIVGDVLEERIGEIFTMIPGEVVSWDSSKETAEIKPTTKDPEGNLLPNVIGAKVCFSGVYWDLQRGETGLIIFSMMDFDSWWRTGQINEPANLDTHDFGQAVFIPGLKRKSTSRNVPSGATVLAGDDVRLGEDSASESVLRGDSYTSDLDSFLTALGTMLTAVAADLSTTPANGVTAATQITQFTLALQNFKASLLNSLSQKVKVD